MLLNITGPEDLGLFEVNEAAAAGPGRGRRQRQHHLRLRRRPVDARRGPGHRDRHRLRGLRAAGPLAAAGAAAATRAGRGSPPRTPTSADLRVDDDDIDVPPFLRDVVPSPTSLRLRGHRSRRLQAHAAVRRCTPRRAPSSSRSPAGRCRCSTRGSARSTSRCAPHAGMFDVSHMGEVETEGPAALGFLQRVLSNDVSQIEVGGAQYSCLCNERRRRPRRPLHLPARPAIAT